MDAAEALVALLAILLGFGVVSYLFDQHQMSKFLPSFDRITSDQWLGIMRKMAGYAGVLMGAAIFIAGVFAYFIKSFDPVTRAWYDGLGRRLIETPWIAKFFLGHDDSWPGWQWFAVDFVVFWGGLAIAYKLVQFGFKDTVPAKR